MPEYLYFVSYISGATVGNTTVVMKGKVDSHDDIRAIESYLGKRENKSIVLINIQLLCGGEE